MELKNMKSKWPASMRFVPNISTNKKRMNEEKRKVHYVAEGFFPRFVFHTYDLDEAEWLCEYHQFAAVKEWYLYSNE